MENGGYPLGADLDPRAPYNQKELPMKEVTVTVSVTLSKTMKIKVNDYSIEEGSDKDGSYPQYNFSECDIQSAVRNKTLLPQDSELFADWDVDDEEFILE